jgi:D-sedoheptulose 7-phosphate isomerase
MAQSLNTKNPFVDYSSRLQAILSSSEWSAVAKLAEDMHKCWKEGRRVFLCGNGGSAGNAIHLANDFLYGIAKQTGKGLKVSALSSNSAVITCLANDVGYDSIFSEQLAVQAEKGDLLIALSGSGNSKNILKVIEQAKLMAVKSYAILGFTGGLSKTLVDVPIHFPVNDMQIAEDLQIIVGHMLMQWLSNNRPEMG